MDMTLQRTIGLLAVLGATLTACSPDPQSTPTSTRAETPALDSEASRPTVLRLGTGDAKTAPAADHIRWFAKRVDDLTDGRVRIKPVWLAAGDVEHFETSMAQKTIDGDLDLALVATRAWDTVGVKTLTPLNAPFLVTSDELVAQVVSEPIRDDLLTGLPEVGVVGIDLWPEGLRHPFGFAEPLNGPSDYEGALIRAPYSRTTEEVFGALGARTTDGAPDPTKQEGSESAYRLAPAGTATGNVVFYPKINALVANAAVEAALTDEEREALARAADDTRDWVVDSGPSDNEAARNFCDEGGEIQSASASQVEALREATEPVLEMMREDEVVGPMIEDIENLAERSTVEAPLTSCGDETDDVAVRKLNGTYTFQVTPAAARKAGVTTQSVIDSATGRFTVNMTDGTWNLHQVYATGARKSLEDHGLGDYIVSGDRLTWFWTHEPGGWVKATFDVLPDGSVEFSKVTDGEGPEWERMAQVHYRYWKRIGDTR